MLILDVTAGNRAMWPCKNPPNTFFLDKETGLSTPPDILCVWQHLPIREDIEDVLIIFDPPHEKFGRNSVHMDPRGWDTDRYNAQGKKIGGTFWSTLPRNWAGVFYKAQKEFSRVASRMCFKWNTSKYSLERVLHLFEAWDVQYIKEHHSNRRRGKTRTYWVTFTPK